MDPRTATLLALWKEGRTRFTNLLEKLTETDLLKKLALGPNSAGFLVRHIGDVELLFAKNVFGLADVQVHASTAARSVHSPVSCPLATTPASGPTWPR